MHALFPLLPTNTPLPHPPPHEQSVGAALEDLLELCLMPRFVDLLVEIGEIIESHIHAGVSAPLAAGRQAAALLELLDSDHATPTLVWNDAYRKRSAQCHHRGVTSRYACYT